MRIMCCRIVILLCWERKARWWARENWYYRSSIKPISDLSNVPLVCTIQCNSEMLNSGKFLINILSLLTSTNSMTLIITNRWGLKAILLFSIWVFVFHIGKNVKNILFCNSEALCLDKLHIGIECNSIAKTANNYEPIN